MTTPRPRLTREQAFDTLTSAGWPHGRFTTNLGFTVPFPVLAVAVGLAESDLYVDAQGPPNTDGSIDRGWLQVNSVHGYDSKRLLSDPAYTASCALEVLLSQGVRAWSAYKVRNATGAYPYARHMPPGMGGPTLTSGTRGEVQRSVQAFLNREKIVTTPLVEDGAYGARTATAVTVWKRKYTPAETSGTVNAAAWTAMATRGLR